MFGNLFADIAQYFAENWYWLAPALFACGGIIVKATPTQVDDEWWEAAKRVWKAIFGTG